MLATVKTFLKSTPLVTPLIFAKSKFQRPTSQNDEALILRKLLSRFDIPKLFVEFGFSGWEFNCAELIETWNGLLLDGGEYNVRIAKTVCPKTVVARQLWLTLDNMHVIRDYVGKSDLGILSIDVDGNDYWFLKSLISLKPALIIAEYNSSFGHLPLTVPYDPKFDRIEKHATRTYYGASLSALTYLANKNDYALVDVSNSGVNAFFVRKDLMGKDDIELHPEYSFREQFFADKSRTSDQWLLIENMPFVDVKTVVN